jgi:hypothetical protein
VVVWWCRYRFKHKKSSLGRLPIEDGFIRLGLCTISDLRSAARVIREQNKRKVGPKTASLHKLIASMKPHAARHHGLTVAQFFVMRARRGSAMAARPRPPRRRINWQPAAARRCSGTASSRSAFPVFGIGKARSVKPGMRAAPVFRKKARLLISA